jgi:isoleucyl-tRNA synthetase
LKEGRFGEWLREVKDWAVSRERYWGTPLPVWQCERCKKTEVIGSRKDFLSKKVSKNNYFIIRHGRSVMNEKEIIISTLPEKVECPLTKEGEESVRQTAEKMKNEKIRIDFIFSSDLLRAKQTAEIIARELGVKEIVLDSRLRDIQAGDADGKSIGEYFSFWKDEKEMFTKTRPGGECYNEVKVRMYNFVKEIDKKYEGKNILIVSHQRPLAMLEGAVLGLTMDEFFAKIEPNRIKTGEFRRIEFKQFPYDLGGELDFHRPYVDEVEFICGKCGFKMKRVSEVLDCWFDSGSMLFAQWHWPFENNELITKRKQFPAEFISEAVDQTRGWFYTLLAVSTLLDFGTPYKNVISLGHVLDKKGEKMSKSKGNAVNPWDQIDKFGVDTLRWYFFTGSQPGEPKKFDEDGVRDFFNKFILTLWNSFVFFQTYKTDNGIIFNEEELPRSKNIIDRWIISKVFSLINDVRKNLDKYDITSAGRAIEKFTVEDFSNWYIRRSRKRFQKPESEKEKQEAFQTSNFIMVTLSKLCAPFIPFLSEMIYRSLVDPDGKILKSVHLCDFPKEKFNGIDKRLENKMNIVRKICTLALMVRSKSGIKVRQPLLKMEIKIDGSKIALDKNLLGLIREELNVVEVAIVNEIEKEVKTKKTWLIETEGKITVALDSELTPELKEEGTVREIVRQIQELRKKAALTPEDGIKIFYEGAEEIRNIIDKNKKSIMDDTLAKDIIFSKNECLAEKTTQINKIEIWFGLTKAE